MPLELIELVKSGGAIVAPVFVYLWWFEREERRAYQTKNEQLSERTITAMVRKILILNSMGVSVGLAEGVVAADFSLVMDWGKGS